MAEHRTMQRDALLDAARSLLTEGGTEALTFPALAERTGLARSSVYEYFRSRAAVVEELCSVDFPVWAAEVEAAMEAADGAAAKIEAYVRSQLTLVGDRRHRAVVAISAGELDAGAREKIRAAHGGLVAMVVEALGDLGHEEPRLTAMLLQGVVDAAVRRIELGAAEVPERIVDAAVAMALRGVQSPATTSAPTPEPALTPEPAPVSDSVSDSATSPLVEQL
ncbi:TetR/AcrR family transcriptional regulator [Streptomyces fildesensis]|uniref:TetR/AcrR family transcriptional regulator n=1 Tax=Streptomyces fildesensis TaxID=375757 RepID=UPI0027DCF66C|nr:helix-turn-helix domain-containing protein [Streptomyces fildesensis]